ncbi:MULTISPECIES: GntR family transcriptional regulator [Aerococcus]|uniref:GntR family transcriptional regulator n=1 Tax=Aerococcus loyolae TaxID=2976809 RepID=A0ABT4BX36_9LACT|nr:MULTISPECIES: GntR family transcriptional regulator [Aerococcus]KAA9218402.1 GntR family transcriptional regulator [Aerococcus loyolae]MCY3024824.1 GntR family transcriptional regulator [Aerococcus loyolae]MCY3026777.1 GntR family transcriptional regulator [Aerococcus loyolae]MCY3028744.1 GntR family transcriptional regulator [Aerococcus loyolae]MDK6231794.1 GntR family transcriptional regulator [Aerococcus urinae]
MGKQQKLEQIAYLYMKDQIIQGNWPNDHHIVEAAISEKLDMSRSPIRAALAILADEEIVEMRPYRGFFVKTSLEDVDLVAFRLRYFAICYFRLMDRALKHKASAKDLPADLDQNLNNLIAAFESDNYLDCVQWECAIIKSLLNLSQHDFLVEEAIKCYASVLERVHNHLQDGDDKTHCAYQARNIIYIQDIIFLAKRNEFDETRTLIELLTLHQYQYFNDQEKAVFDQASPYAMK